MALGDGSRGGTASRGRKRLRNGFVVGQIAVALALLVGATELRQVMNSLVFADNGFRESRDSSPSNSPSPSTNTLNSPIVFSSSEEMVRESESHPGSGRSGRHGIPPEGKGERQHPLPDRRAER